MKECRGCDRRLPLDEYHRNKNLRDGRETKCRSCRSGIAKEYRRKYRPILIAQTRRYQERNRDYFREYNRRYRAREASA